MVSTSSPTTRSDLAVRNGSASTALALRSDQTEFNDRQRAALVAMGVSERATRAELAVFFHQCRNTQLDPFLKQIYLIHRRAKENGAWVDKPTTQTGIDGFRVIRDRIADRKEIRVEYEDTLWYDAQGQAYDVWLWDEPPAACRVTVRLDGRRFPSVLRFSEYCQTNREGERTGKWRDAHSHQIEKCAEADALRKAFPNDMAGLVLEDAAPLGDPDAPAAQPQRPSAQQIRQQRPVAAEVVTPDPPPAPADSAPAHPGAGGDPAGPAPGSGEHAAALRAAQAQGKRLFGDDRDTRIAAAEAILGYPVASFSDCTPEELAVLTETFAKCKDAQALAALLDAGEVTGDESGDE